MDWLAEYTKVVTPMLAIFQDQCKENQRRYRLHHQVGLINTCISLQQFILLGNHIEKTEGEISVERCAKMMAEIFHLQADQMVFMSDMNDNILEVVVEAMYPVVAKCVEAMNLDFGDVHGE